MGNPRPSSYDLLAHQHDQNYFTRTASLYNLSHAKGRRTPKPLLQREEAEKLFAVTKDENLFIFAQINHLQNDFITQRTPPAGSAQTTRGLGDSCRVHKPGVPRGPASALGLGPGKHHVVHGPAQESKKQQAGRIVRASTGRSTQKNKRPLFSFSGPPLRPEHSLRAPAASRRSLRSEGLAQNVASYSDPVTPIGDP